MKWLKRILIAFVLFCLLVVAGFGLLVRMARSRPDWYPTAAPDASVIKAASRSAEDKLAGFYDWAADTNASERNHKSGIAAGKPGYVEPPDPVKTLNLTEAELNAVFRQWSPSLEGGSHYSEYISEPMIVLQDNRIILAGTVKSANALVSLHFEPKLEPDGRLRLNLVRVMGGCLPLPRAIWSTYSEKLEQSLIGQVRQAQKTARIADDGSMNKDAVSAEMDKFLLHALRDEPADAILFFPHDLSDNRFPVRVTEVKVIDKSVSITVVPLTAAERVELLKRAREPWPDPEGDAAAAGQSNAASPGEPTTPKTLTQAGGLTTAPSAAQ